MAKEPKANWSSFTKAELIRTIKALDKRQTQLLNRIAKLEAERTRDVQRLPDLTIFPSRCTSLAIPDWRKASQDKVADDPPPQFPWDSGPRAGVLPNPFETEPER